MRKVLNVGGNSKNINLPEQYHDWQHDLLDIDPNVKPDILCDARQLKKLPPQQYDAIYCSHNLEHYYQHEVLGVVEGFAHLLKDDGFVQIRVPDIYSVMEIALRQKLEMDDVLYRAKSGDITLRDILYGYQKEIIKSRQDFFAHKNAFTSNALRTLLKDSGFPVVALAIDKENLELKALGFKQPPNAQLKTLFNIKGL